ncbi:MAG: S49 family peptidase [Pseudomonadota bacterium]
MAFYSSLLPKRLRRDETVIPVVQLHGMIAAGGSQFRPPLNLATVAPLLKRAFSDKKAPAVALSINSPGGSPVQSRLIFQRIRDLAQEKDKHVLVFVEDLAASGGYMIALAGDEIYADPTSIVGSIGVVSASFGFTNLIKKIGVDRRVYTAGKNKVTLDPFQPEKKADVDHLKSLQLEVHQVFIDMVKERRGGKLVEDDTMFSGLFWSGIRGKEMGLVDELGDMRSVLKQRYGEKTNLRLITMPRGLFGRRVTGAGGGDFSARVAGAAATGIADIIEERAFWARYGL